MNNMKVIITKTNVIKSVEDWRMYAPPQNPKKHWKEGHSAKLLAKYVTNKNFANDVEQWIKDCHFSSSREVFCEPEVTTSFPNRGLGRKHDLIIEGKDFIIGVEAKVSESFGARTIEKEYEGQSEGKQKRVEILLKYIGKSYEEAKNYKYQLLTGLVGTLLEAKRKGKEKCLFIVISFTGDVDASSIGQETNNNDYAAFCSNFLGLLPNGGMVVYNIDGTEITCYIRKIEVNVERRFDLIKSS